MESEINIPLRGIFTYCRIFGVFPVQTVTKHGQDVMKFSPILFVYSLALVMVQSCFSLYSLFSDHPEHNDIFKYQKNVTVSVVMFCDISFLAVSCTLIVIFSGRSTKRLIGLYKDLEHFDEVINLKPKKSLATYWLVGTLGYLICLLIFEATTRFKIIPISLPYFAVFSQHFIVLAFQLQFFFVVDSIRQRFTLINHCVKHSVIQHQFKKALNFALPAPVEHIAPVASQYIEMSVLSDLYWLLAGTVYKVNSIFSWQLFAFMTLLFLHIIIAPYYLLFVFNLYTQETGSNIPITYILVQLLWVFTHCAKLVLLVYPCAATTNEANQTASILCRVLNKEVLLSDKKKQLETFLLQLTHQNSEFSVLGLFPLNSPILTSISGAVTTYLVILIQFQNAGSGDTTTNTVETKA